MSNLYTRKGGVKPLKGSTVSSNFGTFETVTATTLVLDNVDIGQLAVDGFLDGATIENSNIYNTIIGANGPSQAFFTDLETYGDVKFNGIGLIESASWDPITGIFKITNQLTVEGCSFLGNIKICNNDISSVNANGDINVKPNGLGNYNVYAPVFVSTSNGSFYTDVNRGGVTFLSRDNILLRSTAGTISLASFGQQNYTSTNGDISINVDTGISNKSISAITRTSGTILVTTFADHLLQSGDAINISSSTLVGSFNVQSVVNSKSIVLNQVPNSLLNTTFTGGNLLKSPSNNIILNSGSFVQIPNDTRLAYGSTCNSISGNTQSLTIKSCNNVQFDVASNKVISIPESTKLQLGTSANNFINLTAGSLNISSDNIVTVNGLVTQLNSTNTKLYDPIVTLADYPLSSNDLKDRGVEFKYYDTASSSMKLGWFGFRNATKSFTFILDAINNNEIISGSPGNFEYDGLSVQRIDMVGNSVINMNCGNILNTNLISGCTVSNSLTVSGPSNVTVSALNRISLSSSTDVLVPNNIPVLFGTMGSFIRETTSGNVLLAGQRNIQFITQTKGSFIIPVETAISFDGTSVGSIKAVSNTVGDLIMQTNKSLYLTTTGGNVIVPTNTAIQLGAEGQLLVGTTSGINLLSLLGNVQLISNTNANVISSNGNITLSTLNSGDIQLYTAQNGSIRIPGARHLVFGTSGTMNSISLNTLGNLILTGATTNSFIINGINTLDLLATSNINIPTNTRLNVGSNSYLVSDTSGSTSFVNTNSIGNIVISANNTNITNTNGSLSLQNITTIISSASVFMNGNLAQIDSTNVRFKDPIITLGESIVDVKDRGVEFNYGTKLGWFGYKKDVNRFMFYSDAINTNEIISGTIGDLEVSNAYIRNSLNLSSGGTIDLSCGAMQNVNTINGCGGVLNLNGSTTINQSAQQINLTASQRVTLPFNVPFIFGNASNQMSCDSNGNLTISSSKIVLNSDLQVNGTTMNVYSTVTNIEDPIFSIGGVTGPIVNDLKDRGIEFKWNNGSASKTGFFGYKQSLDRFVFIKDGTNTNEVFSGAFSNVQFGDGYFSNINLSNGNISGVQQLSGGQLTISSTSGNINITPTKGNSVLLPYDTPLGFGTTSNGFSVSTSGAMTIQGQGSITIQTTDSIRVPSNVPFYFGLQDNASYILRNTANNMIINNSLGSIYLQPQTSTGQVYIPPSNLLAFGSTSNSIYSDGQELFLNGYKGISISGSSVTIAGNINIVGTLSAGATDFDLNKYILPLGTFQIVNVSLIENFAGTNGNLRVTTATTHNFSVNDTITLKNTPELDGTYQVKSITGTNSFTIEKTTPGPISSNVTAGSVKSNLMTPQGKDVGIGVNYWSTTGNIGVTSGSAAYKTGFFGFKSNTERWSFYTRSTISNDIVTGDFGDVEVNKVFTNRLSGFVLDGGVSGGSNLISGNNFQISGGNINNTPVGVATAQTGRFTNLSSTVQSQLMDTTLLGKFLYSVEKYSVNSSLPFKNPISTLTVVSMFSVVGTSFTGSSATMSSTNIVDGTLKILVCSSMGDNCTHTVHFGQGRIVSPNPLSAVPPSKLVFKRTGQSVQLVFDATNNTSGGAWIILNSGCYVE